MKSIIYNSDCLEAMRQMPDKAFDLGFDFVGYELDCEYWLAQEERFAQHIAQPKLFSPTPIIATQDQLFVTI